ncbi:MAG: hypothetical protein ACPGF7_13670 [Pontibacterium sp.]
MGFECLNEAANQTGFAGLVGVSQQAISARVRDGELPRDGTYGEWLDIYLTRLRDEASGRGGDDEGELRRARTEDMQASAALKRLQFNEKAGELIVRAEAHAFLASWATFSSREFSGAVDRLIADIESQFGVTVPPEVREKHAATAISRIRDYGLQPGESRDGGGAVISATEADANG